jgi:hypothetical protein
MKPLGLFEWKKHSMSGDTELLPGRQQEDGTDGVASDGSQIPMLREQ